MKSNLLHIKQEQFNNRHIHNKYYILLDATKIGSLVCKKKNNILILGYLYIYPEYQQQGYGKQTIEYILSHYKIKCIVGETSYESKRFWNKCIKQYNGQKRKINYCDNCSNSFVIPKYNITDDELYDLLEIAYWIN